MKFHHIIYVISILLLTGCTHKDLVFDHESTAHVRVIFDWEDAPDANPRSMTLYMYSSLGGEPLRYTFDNKNGGYIYLPYGTYDALALNGDIYEWAAERNLYDASSLEVLTPDMKGHTTYAPLPAEYLEHLLGKDAGERVILPPGLLYTGRTDGFSVSVADGDKTIILRPREATCHYTIDIINVENISALGGATLNGTLSQMAESYFAGAFHAGEKDVAIPCYFVADAEKNTLHSEFLTFGHTPSVRRNNNLRLYLPLKDNSVRCYDYDVTSQAHDAPDPHHVHIVIDGLSLPHTIDTGGGIIPDVNEWESVIIPIPM
ncbi:MAG: DUF5119 domain-containing protein [Bacteroidales bacterium]|nr:DUF5119 domain-containing protein [Bacteroidales bacterium]